MFNAAFTTQAVENSLIIYQEARACGGAWMRGSVVGQWRGANSQTVREIRIQMRTGIPPKEEVMRAPG